MTDEAIGNCFNVAATIVVTHGRPKRPWSHTPDVREGQAEADKLAETYGAAAESIRCCHGYVTRPADGHRHTHAWVEIDMDEAMNFMTVVLDYSNGHEIALPREAYYKLGEIKHEDVVRYDQRETLANMLGTEHYGPWDQRFDDEEKAA